jgi:hypothetical protein
MMGESSMIAISPGVDTIALPTISPRRSTAARRRVSGQEPRRNPSNSPLSFIGKNRRGNRLVHDQQHLCAGLFIDDAAAPRLFIVFYYRSHHPLHFEGADEQ